MNRMDFESFGVRRFAALFGRKSSVERFDFFREPPVVRFQKRRKAPHSKTLREISTTAFNEQLFMVRCMRGGERGLSRYAAGRIIAA